ncbi:TPA: hypothetical protein DIV55_00340 [Patescibacteria group bacterium]|nr:hypothetical protein [Patescibacteria group bacterium]
MKTVIVRNRGQLTIPGSIRKTIDWISPMSAVTISVIKPDEIVIRPHKKVYDWNKIWAGVKQARAIKGKGNATSTIEFLQKDRRSH